MSAAASPSLKQFVIRPWIWHFILTLIFAVMLLLVVRVHYTDRTANKTDFLLNLAALPLIWTHTLLILIFSMRRFSRKQVMPGLIYLVHFFASASLGFYAYLMMAIGWMYSMKQ